MIMNIKGDMIMNKRENMVMNKRAKTAQLGKLLIIFASLILCLGMGTTQALAASVSTTNNNFTMIDATGLTFGGTNDETFTWDGTLKTSVAVFGQVSNATLSQACAFFGFTFSAHDVAIYGPGTYTIYDGCAAGSPGCGSGNPVTFTVGAGQLGAHMLFLWNGNDNIDVVDVWQGGKFAPSQMCDGDGLTGGYAYGCGTNSTATVWDAMSTDWNGDGVNGAQMTDGPFLGSYANFSVMLHSDPCLGQPDGTVCDDNNACTTGDICTGGVCGGIVVKDCNDNNACTVDSCDAVTGNCVYTEITCDDENPCTTDICDAKTGCVFTNNTNSCDDGDACTTGDFCQDGVCVRGTCIEGCGTGGGVDTTGNNFSMLDTNGATFGGTNDVRFIWDGTTRTSVAVSGQVSNASITSITPFFGFTWATTDVAVYGPGTYTVYTDCLPGSPGCGKGASYTFTVGVGELGAHMLFKWGAPASTTSCGLVNCDIDVVDVWAPGKAFAPSAMWTGAGGSNSPSRVWDWMSKDWDGDGKSGAAMVDGPFVGCNANFNVMGVPGACNNSPSEPALVYPVDGATGMGTPVEFRWMNSTDPDAGDTAKLTYLVTYCTNTNDTASCTSVDPVTGTTATAKRSSKGMFYAGGAGLLMIGLTFIGGSKGRRRIVLLLVMVVLFAGGTLISCQKNSNTEQGKYLDINQMSYQATGLKSGTTYYWNVEVSDGKSNGTAHSPRQGYWSFTTK